MPLQKEVAKRAKNGCKYLFKRQVYLPDGRRTTIRLGNISEKAAVEIDGFITQLVEARDNALDIPPKVQQWLESVNGRLLENLVAASLCSAPDRTKTITWEEHSADFLARKRQTVKPGTIEQLEIALNQCTSYLPKNIKLRDLTGAHAKGFYSHMLNSIGENTAKKRLARCREVLHDAVEMELIESNKFVLRSLPVAVGVADKQYVPEHIIEDVIAIIPEEKTEWALLLALSRWLGCRIPSEIQNPAWDDIDWEANTICIKSPKTERQAKANRLVPIFDEIAPLLKRMHERNQDSAYVLPHCRHLSNPATTLKRWVRKAGHEPWKEFFNSLRASRETDLMDLVGLRRACLWIGNTTQVAERNYRLIKSTDFVDEQKPGLGAYRIQKSGAKSGAAQACLGAHSDHRDEKTPGRKPGDV